jgi:hypothetical protein
MIASLVASGAAMRRWNALDWVGRAVVLCVLEITACTPQGDPGIGADGYRDNFDRADVGSDWNVTGGSYAIREGQLRVKGARNKPMWLRRTLPHDVRITFDVRSESSEGDIKVELFGDGVSKAETTSYTATSYVVVFGGWGNTLNVLARMNEHGEDRVVGPSYKVVQGKTYHMKIERRGATIKAWANDHELAKLTDANPLTGPGHDHFAFNNWQSELWFDNLRIDSL